MCVSRNKILATLDIRDMLKQAPHLMHQCWPWGVQLGWQQEGGAAEIALKKGMQRVTQGQPAAAALALLASALAVGELWEHVVEKWLVIPRAELLQKNIPVTIRRQQYFLALEIASISD